MRALVPRGRDNAGHRCPTPPQLGSPVFILASAGPARQPGDCPLCPREEIVSTDFEEKILLIFVTRGNSSPHITGQTSWRLRRKGGLGKKTQIRREEDELEDLLVEEEERCIRVNLSQSADLCDYQDTCTLFASKHLRGD